MEISKSDILAFEDKARRAFHEGMVISYETSKAKGWYESERSFGDITALFHSEISEAFEAYRHGNPESRYIPGFTQVEEELADLIIRVFDYSAHSGQRLAEAVAAKMNFNLTRPHRHGGKRL
jgi:NTP pyrophosphatase (non-canonical NTP hydrolase)